ncbi:MAG: hypothetical protein OEZ59_00005 [Deltaproteobacteria bacterium]|nr:hypothetical protein [Deltaproteobacteria bacterium]
MKSTMPKRFLLILLLPVFAAGCLAARPLAPHPSVVYVPRPGQINSTLGEDELQTMFTTSPDRNPDGLGVYELIWPQSSMTLVPWELQRFREERRKTAYARSESEHEQALSDMEKTFGNHVIFQGYLISYFSRFTEPGFYEPEGIYLLDDRGRKFKPVKTGTGYRDYQQEIRLRETGAGYKLEESAYHFGYPHLYFPGDALTPQTKALMLFFAASDKRIRFTWIFDPDYVVPGGSVDAHMGRDMDKLRLRGN